ncbi:hypothetical protein [Methylobacterium radiodurans]|uniref:Terminase small subunit, Nu1 n=1 Tax=Methylobacterium radiodurans TaxID=2202828 RepID=A0A2U8VQM5_9HYPH|nr:hypothetical protein [Methylobacterium radiodurans]AWN35768.1 hypothetical protein DK427_08430 [Methylobacterium radiodurans]
MEAAISAQALSDLTGLSTRRLRELAEKGVLPRTPRGLFPHPQAIRAYCSGLREQAAGRSSDESGGQELVRERALLAREQREAQALKNAVLRGETIDASEAERRWTDEMVRLRSRLLGVPSDVAQLAPHMTKHDIATVDRALRDAMDEASRAEPDAA